MPVSSFFIKWWTYQKERFPVAGHGPLILTFSLCALCYSRLLRGETTLPHWETIGVAFLCCFFSFLHLRIADEFKDFEEDSKFRSYRPVPRGLVTLKELGVLWFLTGALQLLLAILLAPGLGFVLLLTWFYLALMSKEFFCKKWLKSHPFTYMWTHMFIMPLIDLYATACDWLPAQGSPPPGLWWFVIVSFFNGFVIEVGRKIRAPEDEEQGVETYSVLWGRKNAVIGWWMALVLTGATALVAAFNIKFIMPVAISLGLCFVVAVVCGIRFLKHQNPKSGKGFEILAGIWTLVLYLVLGVVPLLIRSFP